MTIFKFKRKRLSEEYYDKVSEESKKERLRYYKRKEKAGRPKVLTEEEKAEKRKNFHKKAKEESKEIEKPVTIIEIMQEIRKIYRRGELEDLAGKTGIHECWFKSWIQTNRRPEGWYLKTLQKYFAKNRE
jgi:hypothetical protein